MLVILLLDSVLRVRPGQAARGGDARFVAVVVRPSTPGSLISISKPLAPLHPWEHCLYDRLGSWTVWGKLLRNRRTRMGLSSTGFGIPDLPLPSSVTSASLLHRSEPWFPTCHN